MLKYNTYSIIVIIMLIHNLVKTIAFVKNVLKEKNITKFEMVYKVINESTHRKEKSFKNTMKVWMLTKLDPTYMNDERKLKYSTAQEIIRNNGVTSLKFIRQKFSTNISMPKNNGIRVWKKIKRKMRFTSPYKIITKDSRRVDRDLSRICGVDSYEDDLYGCEYSDVDQNKQRLKLVDTQAFSNNQEEIPKEQPVRSPINEWIKKQTTRQKKDFEQFKEEENSQKKQSQLKSHNQQSKDQEYHKVEHEDIDKRNDELNLKNEQPKEDSYISNEDGEEIYKLQKPIEDGNYKSEFSDELATDYIPSDIKEDLEDLAPISPEHGNATQVTNVTHITTSTPIIWLDGTVPKKQEVPTLLELCADKARCRIPFQDD